MFNFVRLFLSLFFLTCLSLGVNFSPKTDDFNAYGLKMAANGLMIVEAQNDYSDFLVQFAPYTDDFNKGIFRTCSVKYQNASQYIYTVALGKNQSTYNVFFVGEIIDLDEDAQLVNRTFVGILSYNGSNNTIDCNNFSYTIQYVPIPLAHQEHLVMVTDPSWFSCLWILQSVYIFLYSSYK